MISSIEHFEFCTNDDFAFEPNFSADDENLFENLDQEAYRRYSNSKQTGVAWMNERRRVMFLEKGMRISGWPSPDMKKAILIYPEEHPIFPYPGNAVIHNADGSVYLRLNEPKLISKQFKERKRTTFNRTQDSLWYDGVSWGRDSNGSPLVVVSIGFDHEWTERRVLNVDTGELEGLYVAGANPGKPAEPHRSFFIKVDEDGRQTPMMEFFPPQYSMLSNLGLFDFARSEKIASVLDELENSKLAMKEYTFASDDWCIVQVKGDVSNVSSGFDEFAPFELKTDFFARLFKDWLAFLVKYESGKIKGLGNS